MTTRLGTSAVASMDSSQQQACKRSFTQLQQSAMLASVAKEGWLAGYLDHEEDHASDYEDEDDDISYESEEETQLAQAILHASTLLKPTRRSSISALDTLMQASVVKQPTTTCMKRARVTGPEMVEYPKSSSMPNLAAMKQQPYKVVTIAPKPTTTTTTTSTLKPDDYLRRLLLTNDSTKFVKYHPAFSLSDFFEPLDEDSIRSYDMELVRAVREQDLEALQHMHNMGRLLHAGNKFGETILHAAARRGATSVVDFLLHTAHVPPQVCCDYGRTPLHDACWTAQPNFDVVAMLLDACPDFLYITDKRGFTPLAYAPPESYPLWYSFLEQRGASALRPRQLV